MSEYKHGPYGQSIANADRSSVQADQAPIYGGTAPSHTCAAGNANKDKPVVLTSFMDAVNKVGYSEDWAKYTLCEAIYYHFCVNQIGPLVVINSLDVDALKVAGGPKTASLTPVNGRITIADAEDIILGSVKVGTKVAGKDYAIAYDYQTRSITIAQTSAGSLGAAALSITYETVDASSVTEEAIIGATDGEGVNTGLHAVMDVYQVTGFRPSMLLAPGWSHIPAVHDVMMKLSRTVNSHWDLIVYSDIPLLEDSQRMTMDAAVLWKKANGYNHFNEKPFFPMAEGTDDRHYHISVIACANKQVLDAAANGVPYQSCSNTAAPIIRRLFFGDEVERRIDDATVNEKLNKHGITSAAYVGGRWAVWGPHSGQYTPDDATETNVFDTTVQMLYYITNDFQHRRALEIDKPMSKNRLAQIVAEEQARLDALQSTGALTYGEAYLAVTGSDQADMRNGDFKIKFSVTTTPLAKSLTALVAWTDKGFETYFAIEEAA